MYKSRKHTHTRQLTLHSEVGVDGGGLVWAWWLLWSVCGVRDGHACYVGFGGGGAAAGSRVIACVQCVLSCVPHAVPLCPCVSLLCCVRLAATRIACVSSVRDVATA